MEGPASSPLPEDSLALGSASPFHSSRLGELAGEPGFSICRMEGPGVALPSEVRESSGVEPTSWDPELFWTHNDSGWTPHLFLVNREGRLLGRVRVAGAENLDWEDMAAGPCPEGGRCLYIADTGDNREARTRPEEAPVIYRIPEPQPGDTVSAPADAFALRLPHGPRDIEALHLLPGERLFLVGKGRSHPPELYRVPPLTLGEVLVPERIQEFGDRPRSLARMITGAGSTPDGSVVALRTYETLEFFRPDTAGLLREVPRGRVNLRPLREMQGEAVAWAGGDRWVLTGEAGPFLSRGSLHLIRCALPD